ncbi:hypothetical protein GCM10010106_28620 [Thermopolyspora flexuosa]|nr:hypothetical protein GCM10010106_28620 [Thermopolyspora flexuosa]
MPRLWATAREALYDSKRMRGAEADDQFTRGDVFGGKSFSGTTRACPRTPTGAGTSALPTPQRCWGGTFQVGRPLFLSGLGRLDQARNG